MASVPAYEIQVGRTDVERLGQGYPSPESLVEASFAFLLKRESKEHILASFDLTEITTYFPEYERTISRKG